MLKLAQASTCKYSHSTASITDTGNSAQSRPRPSLPRTAAALSPRPPPSIVGYYPRGRRPRIRAPAVLRPHPVARAAHSELRDTPSPPLITRRAIIPRLVTAGHGWSRLVTACHEPNTRQRGYAAASLVTCLGVVRQRVRLRRRRPRGPPARMGVEGRAGVWGGGVCVRTVGSWWSCRGKGGGRDCGERGGRGGGRHSARQGARRSRAVKQRGVRLVDRTMLWSDVPGCWAPCYGCAVIKAQGCRSFRSRVTSVDRAARLLSTLRAASTSCTHAHPARRT